jgi:CheY-like chemotaxis protein
MLAALQERARSLAGADSDAANAAVPSRPRALLVEDSTTVRILTSALLTDAGCDVDSVSDGQSAVDLLDRQPYDLLVTSLETRGIRGLEVVAHARSSPIQRHIPIILVASDAHSERVERAFELGVSACVRKGSLAHDELVETVQLLLKEKLPRIAAQGW